MIGQVGSAIAATNFLQDIGKESRIEDVVFVASGKLLVLLIPTLCWCGGVRTASAYEIAEKLDDASSKLETDWKMDEWVSKASLTTHVSMAYIFVNDSIRSLSRPCMPPL